MAKHTDHSRTIEARKETLRRKHVRITNDLQRRQANRAMKELAR